MKKIFKPSKRRLPFEIFYHNDSWSGESAKSRRFHNRSEARKFVRKHNLQAVDTNGNEI